MLKKLSLCLPFILGVFYVGNSVAAEINATCGDNKALCHLTLEAPEIANMCCQSERVLIYTVTNNTPVTVTVDSAIDPLPGDNSSAVVSITGGDCGAPADFNLASGASCNIEVTIEATDCDSTINRKLVLTPNTNNAPVESIIALNITPLPCLAYIGNDSYDSDMQVMANNFIHICSVALNGSLGSCQVNQVVNIFSDPGEVILNNTATKGYVANTTAISGSYYISVCDVNQTTGQTAGFLETCTNFTDNTQACGPLDLSDPGLRFTPDNSQLLITEEVNNQIRICNVNPNGSLGTCTCEPGVNNANGRPVFNLSGTTLYVPRDDTQNISICDAAINCSTYSDVAFKGTIGMDINPLGTYLYATNNVDGTVLTTCPIMGNGTLGTCFLQTDATFAFSDIGNLFMQHPNGFGYIPSAATSSISICPLNYLTGLIDGNCTSFGGLSTSTSVWIAAIGL